MPKLIVMCGLQCSGKSTKAKELKEKIGNCEIVSSDSIRKEFNNNITNDKVFNIYYDKARQYLNAGKNVILDATNITMKSRRQKKERSGWTAPPLLFRCFTDHPIRICFFSGTFRASFLGSFTVRTPSSYLACTSSSVRFSPT